MDEPLKYGSESSSSSRGLLRLPSVAAAARFSCARRSRPSTEARGVGGWRGSAG